MEGRAAQEVKDTELDNMVVGSKEKHSTFLVVWSKEKLMDFTLVVGSKEKLTDFIWSSRARKSSLTSIWSSGARKSSLT